MGCGYTLGWSYTLTGGILWAGGYTLGWMYTVGWV